jgi:ABC-type phosphate/phosphonate transport system substrate-binding protein
MIASARMYEWTPTLAAGWRRLLAGVAASAGVELEILAAPSLSLDELWSREDLGCVAMCGYPWALRTSRPPLLAAPVPTPERYGGRAVYVSDFIVRADSAAGRLEDTFGRRFAYSSEHSHSGYNAPRHHLLPYRSAARPTLFAEVKGPYGRQRAVVQAVLDGEADVAAIDGYAHDLLRRHDPAVAGRLRTIATTEPAPIPPMVAPPAMPAATRERLVAALGAAHQTPELKAVMDDLLLRRFDPVDTAAYELCLAWARAAEAAGYPRLA